MPTFPSSATPVATPISELIANNLLESLSRVSVANGYLNTLDVRRLEQKPPSPFDGLCVVGAGKPTPQENPPALHDELVLMVGICAWAMERESSQISLDARLASLAADIRRALKTDLHRGGYAVNTEFDADELDIQPPAHVIVWARVRYRTLYNDPYRQ